MTLFFGTLTILCAAYWLLMFLYSGYLLQQHWIWIAFTLFFFLNAAAAWGYRKGLREMPLWLVTAIHTAAFAFLFVFLIRSSVTPACLSSGFIIVHISTHSFHL